MSEFNLKSKSGASNINFSGHFDTDNDMEITSTTYEEEEYTVYANIDTLRQLVSFLNEKINTHESKTL